MIIQPICTHPTRFFCLTITWQCVLLNIITRELTRQSVGLHLFQPAHSIRACVTVMTAKVSGKTAVESERQRKWAELSIWRPPDLWDRNPTCSFTFGFIYWLLMTFDLWGFSCENIVLASKRNSCKQMPIFKNIWAFECHSLNVQTLQSNNSVS